MITKELLDIRWKLLVFALISLGTAGFQPFSLVSFSGQLSGTTVQRTSDFQAHIWEHWFYLSNGPLIFLLFAIVLGCGLIATEVSQGTITFLFSRPLSRNRILLTKYAVSAASLLIVAILSSIAILVSSMILGYTLDMIRLLTATFLFWLGSLTPLGCALIFSIIASDTLRALLWSLLTFAVGNVLLLIPRWQPWSLLYYWSSRQSYLQGTFPFAEYIFCFIAALLPLLLALWLFHLKEY